MFMNIYICNRNTKIKADVLNHENRSTEKNGQVLRRIALFSSELILSKLGRIPILKTFRKMIEYRDQTDRQSIDKK